MFHISETLKPLLLSTTVPPWFYLHTERFSISLSAFCWLMELMSVLCCLFSFWTKSWQSSFSLYLNHQSNRGLWQPPLQRQMVAYLVPPHGWGVTLLSPLGCWGTMVLSPVGSVLLNHPEIGIQLLLAGNDHCARHCQSPAGPLWLPHQPTQNASSASLLIHGKKPSKLQPTPRCSLPKGQTPELTQNCSGPSQSRGGCEAQHSWNHSNEGQTTSTPDFVLC